VEQAGAELVWGTMPNCPQCHVPHTFWVSRKPGRLNSSRTSQTCQTWVLHAVGQLQPSKSGHIDLHQLPGKAPIWAPETGLRQQGLAFQVRAPTDPSWPYHGLL